jgi:hypothetical protein
MSGSLHSVVPCARRARVSFRIEASCLPQPNLRPAACGATRWPPRPRADRNHLAFDRRGGCARPGNAAGPAPSATKGPESGPSIFSQPWVFPVLRQKGWKCRRACPARGEGIARRTRRYRLQDVAASLPHLKRMEKPQGRRAGPALQKSRRRHIAATAFHQAKAGDETSPLQG